METKTKKARVGVIEKDYSRAQRTILAESDLKLGNLKYIDLSLNHSKDFSGELKYR